MFRQGFITQARIAQGIEVASKKRLLEALARLLAGGNPHLSQEGVFERLIQRERLGSTGLGHGIALPHSRVKEIAEPLGAFVTTAQGVDYDAADGEPVDLAFGLLVPDSSTAEHLQLLAELAGRFSNPMVRKALREASSPETVLRLLVGD